MVDILLATYNGEKYLTKQLKSLEEQTYKDWNLLVQDDCSKDETMKILKEFQNKYPEKVEIYCNEINKGHCKTFFSLLEKSKAKFIMFCDQDDIWYKNKIELALLKLKNKRGPLLYHSDQKVINENEEIIFNSAMQDLKKNLVSLELTDFLFNNSITGCTLMINDELKIKVLELDAKVREKVRYHDWSIAIIAKIFGEIIYDTNATMGYRLHNNNASLNKNKWLKIKSKIFFKKRKKILKGNINQYCNILEFYENKDKLKFNLKVNILLKEFKNYENENYLNRIRLNYKFGNWKNQDNILKKLYLLFIC